MIFKTVYSKKKNDKELRKGVIKVDFIVVYLDY